MPPDWRKPGDYSFTAELSDLLWAWEFLRRNPAYRADWAHALSGEPAADPSDPDFYLSTEAKNRWGLRFGLVNPAVDSPSMLFFTISSAALTYVKEGESIAPSPAGSRFPWAVFDLTLPIAPQVSRVQEELERTQSRHGIKPHRIKHHRDLWPLYLRLLDAALDDRTPKQIANVLNKEAYGIVEKKVWAQLQAARKLTWPAPGYLSIFLSSP